MKNGKINPLDVKGIRKVPFPAAHFTFVTLPKYSPGYTEKIERWIWNNLSGRYYIGQNISLDHRNTAIFTTLVGFETPKEQTFFNLSFSE